MEQMGEEWAREHIQVNLLASTYIENVIPKFEELLGKDALPTYKTPMEDKYHPELDDSPLCDGEKASIFHSIIRNLNWIISLRRFDVQKATNSLSRFNLVSREGHFTKAVRILGYLKKFSKGTIIIDNNYPDHSKHKKDLEHNWTEFYPDVEEMILHDILKQKGRATRLTVYVYTDHAHDQVTRRSFTGIIVFLNNTPIRWYSKRQKTVESSTYG